MKLKHSGIFHDENRIKVKIPFTEGMKKFHHDGNFPIITDPLKTKKTAIIGMFILRPADSIWSEPYVRKDGSLSIYDVEHWIFNIDGLSGGGIIANSNVMDGYRLAMQYAITDAVIVGSSTVINDGVPGKDGSPGYMWLPQFCAEWPHLKAADPNMMKRFKEQRKLMQELGYASNREYPAQIVVTQSGKRTDPDLLSASVFHEKLPDGSPVEAYIVTSQIGAEKIKERAEEYNLGDRIDKILITISHRDNPDKLDLPKLPGILFKEYNIILANHDGGKKVLKAFCQAGIIDQFNFTFARKPSLREVVENNPDIESRIKKLVLNNFQERFIDFFDTPTGKIPKSFPVAEIISDEPDEAAVVVLDTRKIKSFGGEQ